MTVLTGPDLAESSDGADLNDRVFRNPAAASRGRDCLENWPLAMLIDGGWTSSMSGQSAAVYSPIDGSLICDVPEGAAADVEAAVRAARIAFDEARWVGLGASARAKILWRAADLIERDVAAISAVETLNNGMLTAMATATVAVGAEAFRFYAGAISKIYGLTAEISSDVGHFHAYTMREPVGVAGLITPWNGPFALACFKVASALAAGCTCVLKPAEETPLTALKLAALLEEAGLPSGVLNVVTGKGEIVGAALASHPLVDKISFTGSTDVGRHIIRASTGNLKKLSLELGGKSPVVIFADADLDEAIQGAAAGIFINAGQVCMAGSRVFVQREAFDRVVNGLAAAARGIRLGTGFDPEVGMGPIVSDKQRNRILELVAAGKRDGGRLVEGGSALPGNGYYVEPTVLADVPATSRAVTEEIFGPVVIVVPFDTMDEVADMANDTDFGLAAAIWTKDISKAHLLAKRIKAGILWINCQMASDMSLPYGGYKQSGWGREAGMEGLEPFLQTKTVYAKL